MSTSGTPSPSTPSTSPRNGRSRLRVLAIVAGAIAGLLALGYAADVALARGEVPRGLRVGGIDVGGKSRDAAAALLERALADRAGEPITVRADDVEMHLDPERAGLAFDAEATIERAGVQVLNPWSRLRAFFSPTEAPLVAKVERPKLLGMVRRVAKEVDRRPREGSIRFEGVRPVGVLPLTGRTLDVEGAADAIADAYLQGDGPVELPVDVTPVKSTDDGVRRALEQIAGPAVAAPIVLEGAGRRVTMPPEATARTLRIAADATGTLVASFDTKQLGEVLAPVLAPVEVDARDAEVDIVDGKVQIRPSAIGRKVDTATLARDLVPVLGRPAPRVVALRIVDAQPKVSTEQAHKLGIKEVVGEFTTYHACCRPRVRNIHRMADIVDGALVLPGETFSLNGYVGERDRARGFVEAPMILNGRYVDSVGGGVSQFATTMFNAVFFSGLQDVYHKAHSYYISRYPAGREATVSAPAPDLKWRNDSPYGVLVKTAYTDRSITVRFWSTKRYDIESISGPRTRFRSPSTRYDSGRDCSPTSGSQGFDITVWRVFKQNGREIKRERFFTRYLPEPRFVCGRASRPRPSPSTSPTPPPSRSPAPQPSPTASPG